MDHVGDNEFSALIDGVLSAPELAGIEAHCKECARCAERKNEYLSMQRALRGLPPVQVNENLALANIRARIASEQAKEQQAPVLVYTPPASASRKTRVARWYPAAALASAALLVFALVFSLGQREDYEAYYAGAYTEYIKENPELLTEKTTLTQGPLDTCIVEQETDAIIRGYQDMRQLYYF